MLIDRWLVSIVKLNQGYLVLKFHKRKFLKILYYCQFQSLIKPRPVGNPHSDHLIIYGGQYTHYWPVLTIGRFTEKLKHNHEYWIGLERTSQTFGKILDT